MLKGKLVMMNSPDAYRTGVVVDVSAEFALVRFDDMIGAGNDSTLPMELICLSLGVIDIVSCIDSLGQTGRDSS